MSPREDVKFFPMAGIAIGGRWHVSFNWNGALGGKVNENKLSAAIKTVAQYDLR